MHYVRDREERQTIINRINALAVVTASSPLMFVVFSAVATLLAVDYDSKSSTLSMLAGQSMWYPDTELGSVIRIDSSGNVAAADHYAAADVPPKPPTGFGTTVNSTDSKLL